MKITTICFPCTETEILLGMKKRGFGAGRWNGFGGKVEEGESLVRAACRELEEESGLRVSETDMAHVADIAFDMGGVPAFACSIFVCQNWEGEPYETEEMRPRWFSKNALPFAEMWPDDVHWLPLVLSGKQITATCCLDAEGKRVETFEYQER